MAYTTIDNGEEKFLSYLYTGTGNTGANRSLTFNGSVDLKPGQIWMAKRSTSTANMHNILETEYHGAGYHWLATNSSGLSGPNQGNCDSFDSNGITLDTVNQGSYYHNENNIEYVVWAFAEIGTSAVSNTDGDITSQVIADQNVGMSYVRWSGNSTDQQTIGHGLGKRPRLIQVFQDTNVNNHTDRVYWWDANSWNHVIKNALNAASGTETDGANGRVGAFDGSSQGTSTHFTVFSGNSSYTATNQTGYNYLAICHTDVQGFKKIGKYYGNGSTDGTFVYCGFKPALIWVRAMNRTAYTLGFDNARNPVNDNTGEQIGMAGASNTAYSDANTRIDILSNGFKWRNAGSNFNQAGIRYAFFAVAENPFVTSTGIPTTAR